MFHLRAKIIGRSGAHRSAAGAVAYRVGSRQGAAALAYRAGTKLRDPGSGRTFDYSAKARLDAEGFGILHTEIMLPAGAPEWMADRQNLIDAIEARERRRDAQLFREIELSLPRELTFAQQRDLVRAFVKSAFVSRGMVADVAIHDERASDGGRNPHAHILLTMREVTADGFGKKVRAWNAPALLKQWRETWAEMANEYLARHGHEKRIDHRSHAARGIDLEPDTYVGPKRSADFSGVIADARDEMRRALKARNIDQIRAKPESLLDAITREKATFTAADMAHALRRATALERDDEAFTDLMERVKASPELVPVASDQQGPVRYSTRAMISCEIDMARAAATLASRNADRLSATAPASLSTEQQHAFFHVIAGGDLTCISGVAGAGKTTTLKAIAAALGAAGYRVRGAAIAGIAAKKLADEAEIPASTIAGLFSAWDRRDSAGDPAPVDTLEKRDALIVDEAGMMASRDMRRLLVEAERAGARVILVGDAQQLQAIGAGAAFRAITDTHGAARLQNVRRQASIWMREATQDLAEGRVAEALARYRRGNALRASATTKEAIDELVAAWMRDRPACRSQLMLSYYVADVEALNQMARAALRAKGLLGTDIRVQVQQQIRNENGEIEQRAAYRTFAEGDRILFTRNDKTLGVQNGSLGYVTSLSEQGEFGVVLDEGRTIVFTAAAYGHIAPGYATTIHKSQGQTVDRSYVLATDRFNAHLAYVALTRHREEATVFYGRDQFANDADLTRTFDRQQPKDSTLDYLEAFKHQTQSRRGNAGREARARSAPKTMQDVVRENAARRRRRQHVRDRIRE